MTTRLVILRHGETSWSRQGRHTGRTDLPLLPEGRDQAKAAAARLEHLNLVATWTSPLRRAVETIELAGFPAAERLHDLAEWDYGSYDGLRTADIRRERPGWEIFTDGVPDGETLDQVAERADRVVGKVRQVEGDVLIVSHGHFARVLAARWLGLEPAFGRVLALEPASLSMLGWKRELPVVIRWNDRAHVEERWCLEPGFPR